MRYRQPHGGYSSPAAAGHLEVWHAASPLGPWEPHPANPVANGARAAGFRNAGRLVKHGGRLYRFGQDCGATYGHRVGAAAGGLGQAGHCSNLPGKERAGTLPRCTALHG